MTNPTTPFSWQMPTSTDLVTDLPADFETFGQAVATSMADLLGGTSGQILSKASNTDMDFTWVTNDVGDITAVTAGTGITGGGTSGAVTVSFDQANFGGGQFAAGKNKIINGDMGIWQRGTSFTPTSGSFSADRFYHVFNGSGSTRAVSRQTFTPGAAPVSGYESTYFMRYAVSVAGTGEAYSTVSQNIEDVRTLAGQTVTFSFYAKAASNITLPAVYAVQRFGSGGSAEVATSVATNVAVTTSWQRFTYSFTMPSVSGKTIGTSSYLDMEFYTPINSTFTLDTWGWQLEAGLTATPFQTCSGSIAGELQLAQRYLPAINGAYGEYFGFAYNTTGGQYFVKLPTTARVAPTGITVSNVSHFNVFNSGFSGAAPTAITFNTASIDTASLNTTTTAGSPTIAAKDPVKLQTINASALILFTGCEL